MTTEPIQKIVLHGQRYVILPEAEYCRLTGEPPLPEPDAQGNVPAVEYARASLARKLIRRRKLAGLTQAELARRAGVRPETLNRIERGNSTPTVASIDKLDRALTKALAKRK